MIVRRARTVGGAAALALMLSAGLCLGEHQPAAPAVGGTEPPGYSGLAQIDEQHYVVVHDTKQADPGPRLGLLHVDKGHTPRYEPITVKAWPDQEGLPNDLEAVCMLPGAAHEALLAESMPAKAGHRGRIFHVAMTGNTARVLRVYSLPKPHDTSLLDNFEGMACAPRAPGRTLVILGGWGGDPENPSGVVRWGELDTAQGVLSWADTSVRFRAPGVWPHPEERHDLSDLYLDGRGKLWAAAVSDGGDDGPFNSVVYLLGRVEAAAEPPLRLEHTMAATWSEDGFKIEGLAGPPGAPPNAFMSFATEDEHLGGVWRPMFFPSRLR
ncbi:MAG: hypothetical protein AB1810_14700 [Pseudomonadota bacterium]